MKPHPYFAGSVPQERAAMLARLGVTDIEDLYAAVPSHLRVNGALNLPEAIPAEADLVRHVGHLMKDDVRLPLRRCFRGGGCWPHVVPEICTEILDRAEFRTAYWGDQYSDHGKYQAFFEYASLMGELLDLEALSLPTYDWGNAAAVSLRMTARMTGRANVELAGDIGPDRVEIIRNYCRPDLRVETLPANHETGAIDSGALAPDVGGVYVELPSFLGLIDVGVPELCAQAHAQGSLVVAGVDPISLGVLAPPPAYGADIACGDLQPLGAGLQFGGGVAGFIATPDEERYVAEYPTYLIGLTSTSAPGEYGFGFVAWDRTSYVRREAGKDFAATTTANCAIAAAVYLSLLGPTGICELGRSVMERARYAARMLSELPGVVLPHLGRPFFKEIVVNFDGSGLTVDTINQRLHEHGFLGGVDLSRDYPGLGQSALICVTEAHAREDIDALVDAVREATLPSTTCRAGSSAGRGGDGGS